MRPPLRARHAAVKRNQAPHGANLLSSPPHLQLSRLPLANRYELGRQPANTKLSSNVAVRTVRCRGGARKFRALRLDTGNFSWGSESTTHKTRILDVTYNSSNNELVSTRASPRITVFFPCPYFFFSPLLFLVQGMLHFAIWRGGVASQFARSIGGVDEYTGRSICKCVCVDCTLPLPNCARKADFFFIESGSRFRFLPSVLFSLHPAHSRRCARRLW